MLGAIKAGYYIYDNACFVADVAVLVLLRLPFGMFVEARKDCVVCDEIVLV